MEVFDATGRPGRLLKELGRGGEGAVYDVQGLGDGVVAKIYHRDVAAEKERKLLAMVQAGDDTLRRFAAWPVATLQKKRGGKVSGLLMPKLSGLEPIHKLYGPAHRKHDFPKADWPFLIHTARNLAAAFDMLHARGHVIGDVNQGNVFVSHDARVRLIDCDSFQISFNGAVFGCEVGVPHFTPPELQQCKSFSGLRRTIDHDAFGFAVLCFHLLFMGRHPFAGVPATREDLPIEKAMRERKFAFGYDAAARGIKPPPNSIGLNTVSPRVRELFEFALGNRSTPAGRRPTPREWLAALEEFKTKLTTCRSESTHKYYAALSRCPWCELEQQSGTLFFIGAVLTQLGGTAFDVERVWRLIGAVPAPPSAPPASPEQFAASANPLPIRDQAKAFGKGALKFAAVAGFLLILGLATQFWWLGGIFAFLLWQAADTETEEQRRRKSALSSAEQQYESERRKWTEATSEKPFADRMDQLRRQRETYKGLAQDHAREMQKLKSTVRERQLQHFLEGYFLEDHAIPQIGESRKATLLSFGIESAGDIQTHTIMAISGFGPSLTSELVNWRRSIEARFRFDPSKGVDPADIAALNLTLRQRRAELEKALLAGATALQSISAAIRFKRADRTPAVESAARHLAQARADVRG